MRTLRQWERIKLVHRLIELKNTGSPELLSKRIQVSKRYLFSTLDQIREMGAEIEFSRKRNTYFYTNNFKLFIKASVKVKVNGVERGIVKIY